MNSKNPQQLDEKTARLIAEMDKSLKNMENSLGQDHIVVAKILDSYATLLRQNNIRILDAINMEARAKAIRAKHNKQEAETQAIAIGYSSESEVSSNSQPSPYLSSSKQSIAKGVLWVLAIIVMGSIAIAGYQGLKISAQSAKKHKQAENTNNQNNDDRNNQFSFSEDANSEIKNNPEEDLSKTQNELDQNNSEKNLSKTEVIIRNQYGQNNQSSQSNNTERTSTEHRMSLLQVAEKILQIKKHAKEALDEGQRLEEAKNFQAAIDVYESSIREVNNAPSEIGRAVYSEDIARVFEAYAKLLDMGGQSESARQYEQQAHEIRSKSED